MSAGHRTDDNTWPWFVRVNIRRERGWSPCGGVLIHNNLVLTAAHCLLKDERPNIPIFRPPDELTIYLGQRNIGQGYSFRLTAGSHCIRTHPKWSGSSRGREPTYDLAMLKLTAPVQYSDDVQPVCLPPFDRTRLLQNCAVAGEGVINTNNEFPTNLLAMPMEWCPPDRDTGVDQLCAITADPKGHPGQVCSGDSGSPLVCKSKDGPIYLLGLVNGGPWWAKCQKGLPTPPAYFINVAIYKETILSMASDLLEVESVRIEPHQEEQESFLSFQDYVL